MSKKKNVLSVIALVLALVSMAASAFAVIELQNIPDYETRLAELTAQNQALQARLDALSATEPQAPAVQAASTNLSATPWADGLGADVTLTLTPAGYTEGDSALFQVYLGQEQAARLVCAWDGTAYTATAQLPAANGYTYTCTLTGADGTEETTTLASPENPVSTELVYLGDALRSYCNLVPEDWSSSDGNLTIGACYIQVQLPQLSVSDTLSCSQANLILRRGDEVLQTLTVSLTPGEGSRSYEATAEHVTFALPELTEGDSLDLWLEVALSDGQSLSSCAGSWYFAEGRLELAAG